MLDERSLIAGCIALPRPILIRGEGSRVWDAEDRVYLDFTAGLGAVVLGHGRADLASALGNQFAVLGHCSNLYGNVPAIHLARRLVETSFAERIWFANSGTEANEAALKFARLVGRTSGSPEKTVLVAFKGGFHGRTLGALSVTHHPAYRRPFGPLLPGVRFAAYNDLASAARVMDDRVAGVIVEPVQGEGGVVPSNPEFLAGLRTLCDRHGAALIFDEVQCGLGRIGSLYAYQSYGVVPDMLTLAKPLAGGLPIGAVLLDRRIAESLRPGQHGSTFSGGPAVCSVAIRVFDVVSDPGFLERVCVLGERLRRGLQSIAAESPALRGVRGRGLLQALVVGGSRRLRPEEIVRRARDRGLLITRAGQDAVRFLPPLTCTEDEIDEALAILRASVREERPRRVSSPGDRPPTELQLSGKETR